MAYQISHLSRYAFSEPVTISHNLAWLHPRNTSHQTVLHAQWAIQPTPAMILERRDVYDNRVHYFEVLEPHRTLSVEYVSQVEVTPPPPLPATCSPSWEEVRTLLNTAQDTEKLWAQQFLLDSPLVRRTPALARYAAPSFPARRPFFAGVLDLMGRIHDDFEYMPNITTVSTPLEEILKKRQGVCQDFAHIAIGALRSLGLAARYVSGYLETLPPPGEPRMIGADASHAWFATLFPGVGWIDLDPTNNVLPRDQHITLAWGRDYTDVPPLKGVVFGGGRQPLLEVQVDVMRLGQH
ncbi:MAG: transglutaminase family protein [Magnetococcales bacterium]|nr:transglutaminase family protein [Magnetococcales bacterium]